MWRKVRTVLGGVLVAACCLGGATAQGVVEVLMAEHPDAALVGVCGIAGTAAAVRLIRDGLARRRIVGWAAHGGWVRTEVGRVWPWRSLQPADTVATVRRAWSGTVDGYPVTAGDIEWDQAAFAGAVRAYEGRGVCVVVRLPGSSPGLAVRHPFRIIGPADRLDVPAVRAAYNDGLIPPWTVVGDELFTVEPVEGRLGPAAIDAAVGRAVIAARMVGRWPLPGGDTETAGEMV